MAYALLAGNHTAYKQVKGTTASAEEIRDIYEGLKQSYLTDFDVMLSGYAPSAGAVEAVGAIGRDLQLKSLTKPGSFFWGSSTRSRFSGEESTDLISAGPRHGG